MTLIVTLLSGVRGAVLVQTRSRVYKHEKTLLNLASRYMAARGLDAWTLMSCWNLQPEAP